MKISTRDIQMFVGGALALTGFLVLIWLPYYLFVSLDGGRFVTAILTGLALPIGIAILMSRPWAILSAQIYLWLVVIAGCIVVPAFCYFVPAKAGRIIWSSTPQMLVSIILLVLIYWSRSRRIPPPNKALEATADKASGLPKSDGSAESQAGGASAFIR